MAKTIKLASVLLKCSLGTGKTDDTRKVSPKNVLNVLLLIALIPLIVVLFKLGQTSQGLSLALSGEDLFLRGILFLASFVIFITGIFSCINTFYLATNLESLLVMPYTSVQITGAKFMVAAFYEYYISIVVIAPLLIGFGVNGNVSALYWVGTFLAILLLPILPLTYSAILAMLIMRVLGGAKNRQRMSALGAFGTVLVTMIYTIVNTYFQDSKPGKMKVAFEHILKTAEQITWTFPDVPFLVRVMHNKDLLSLVWALGVIIVCIAIFLFVANGLYLAGAIGMQDTASSHKALSESQMDKISQQHGIVAAYTKKELKNIFRNPPYYISCLILTLGWPVLLLVPALMRSSSGQGFDWLGLIKTNESDSLSMFMVLFWLILLINAFSTMLNSIANSAISREGQSFFMMKQLPISYKKQLKAKRNAALIICEISGCLYPSLGAVYLMITADLPLWTLPVTALLSFLLVFIIVDLQMITGLLKPRLTWSTQVDAVRVRGWFLFFFLFSILAMGSLIAGWNPLGALGLNHWITIGIFCLVLALVAFLVNQLVYLYGVRKLRRL